MKKPFLSLIILGISLILFSFSAIIQQTSTSEIPQKLSDYQLFEGNISNQKPNKNVYPYSLNTPLFTDYAEKLRFIKLPENGSIDYHPTEVMQFPIGSILVKTFYYPLDFRKPELGRRLIETRLLIHEEAGWKALDYVWNDEQTDAFLEVAGDTKEVSYIDINGKKKKHEYAIPNLNQCKGCHNRFEKMSPIGPSARQLNGSYSAWNHPQGEGNQLSNWQKIGILKNLPELASVAKAPVWNKPETGNLDERARIWLDINCAHCHRNGGPAQTSGLNLSIHETNSLALGILKTPVAAGRGSGNKKYDILPGKPDESILVYRLESTDPGEMMPEVGRKTKHKESIELIREWIAAMK